jgi:hypothetical protein
MILGMSFETFTQLHVVISLVAILTGIVVALAMVVGRELPGLTAVFLATTVLTTLTGFMFPITAFTPALAVGAISALILAVALVALYAFRLAGHWRWIYVVTAMAALYLNVFVLVVQAFQKLAVLQPLAPTQSEPPFVAAQGAVLLTFILLGILATLRYRPAPAFAS